MGASFVHSGENFIVPGREDLATEAENTVSAVDAQGEAVWSVQSDGIIVAAGVLRQPDVVAVSTGSDHVYIAGIDQLGDVTAGSSEY